MTWQLPPVLEETECHGQDVQLNIISTTHEHPPTPTPMLSQNPSIILKRFKCNLHRIQESFADNFQY